MSAGNQYAGEYDIKKCSIMSTKGIEFDIKSVIENISIFENIFTGDIVSYDGERYIILTRSCDIVIRHDGTRNTQKILLQAHP